MNAHSLLSKKNYKSLIPWGFAILQGSLQTEINYLRYASSILACGENRKMPFATMTLLAIQYYKMQLLTWLMSR